ncbi:MAG: MASE3 domain-containing protein, partial [Promethearchaeota archaeon]
MLSDSRPETPSRGKAETIEILIFLLGLVLISFTGSINYLLFHSIAEIFSIVIAGGVFFIGWNSRRYMKNSFFLILGISSLYIGIFDLIHTLSYSGMQIFEGYDSNLPTSLWIAARYLQSLSLIGAAFMIKRSIKPAYLMCLYLVISIILLFLIFTKYFPICYIEGKGLTWFKVMSEYIINFILLISLLRIIRIRSEFDEKVFILILSSIVATMISELAFTFYFGVSGILNFVGHIFKIIAFYFLYKAIIQTGFEDPFDLLFRKIKKNELELENIIKHTGAGITMLDKNGKYLIVNEKAAAELGGKPEDFIGKTLYDVFPKKLANEYYNNTRELIQKGINRAYQRTFKLPIGEKTYWIVEQPLKDIDDKNYSLLSISTDITERIKSEELLAEAELRYRTTFEQSPGGIIILDPETSKAVEFNDVICKILGYTREEFKDLKINDYDFKENPSETKLHIEKILKEGRDDFETKFITKNGEIRDVFVTGKIITLSGKQYLQSTFRDITEQKKAEEKIQNISKFPSENPNPVLRVDNEHVLYCNTSGKNTFNVNEGSSLPLILRESVSNALVDKKIKEIEIKLNNRTFTLVVTPVENVDYVNIYGMDITQRKQAEEKLSQLISTVSHELRTPLTVLMMSIKYLTKNKDLLNDELEGKLMDGISRNIQLLGQLAEDFLLISRIDEKRLTLDLIEYNPLEIIDEILYLMEPIGKEKNVSFEINVDNAIRLKGDPKRIDQIFRVILDNAIKYSNENSKVEISALKNYQGKYNLDGNPGVLFQFKDYGRGIPKEDKSSVFERFFRSSNVNEIAGTGLGLSIAKD